MHVLVIGASGKLGSRLLPALLAHDHTVTAFVRDPSKLTDLLPPSLLSAITVVSGDAEDIPTIKAALLDNKCDALICTAGSPSKPDGSGPPSRQGHISASVATAAKQVGEQTGKAIRGWWVTGVVLLDVPGGDAKKGEIFHDHIPNYRPEHRLTISTLESIPINLLQWSALCPAAMTQVNENPTYPAKVGNEIVFGATYPPYLKMGEAPELAGPFKAMMPDTQMGKEIAQLVRVHTASMEDIADRLAEELQKPDEEFVGKRVGLKNVPGTKVKVV